MMMLHRKPLLILAVACCFVALAPAAENQAEKTQKLIAVLQSGAPFFDKARACQQLGEFGDREAVPFLAALLADEHLSAYARSGLEGIPDPSAAAALRTATATLKGNQLAGVVNSLGVLRDPQAVGLLKKFAADPASGPAREALLALGRIGTVEAVATILQVLAKGPETRRDDAAAACLLAAEKRLADGQTAAAVTLYDGVRTASVALPYRAAATRGAIVARKDDGVPLLIEQLRSPEPAFRVAALTAIREIPSDALASALNAEIKEAPTELQIPLLTALVDCHNQQSLQLLQARAGGENAEARKTALLVLGKIGGGPEARVLLQALAANRSPEESAIAMNSLKQMEGAGIDAEIIQAVATAADSGPRIQFIRLLESRRVTGATGELLKQAAGLDPKASAAALRALKSLAGAEDLPALIALTRSAREDAVREAAEDAVIGLCTRTGSAATGSQAVLAELKLAADSRIKNSWIRILAALGDAKALPAIVACLQSADDAVAIRAMEELSLWPDTSPIEQLFLVVQRTTNPIQHRRALDTIIRLATTAAEEHQRPAETVVKWFDSANQAAQTVPERRLIISGLGRVKHAESLRLLAPYLDDADLQGEAALAILQIAPALQQEDPAALREVLEKISATAKSEDSRTQAAQLASTIPSEARRTALFDGRSLAGWEGDTNVWRVRDGVIVGGSTNGNARNEFLTTARGYTNFVLRLEYKLVGTEGFINGGVQFRSVRTGEPANEMSGFQADIGAGYSGCLYDESRRNTFLVRAGEDQVKRLEKPGEWNRYEVRCAGPRIQILLNGEKTVDYTESNAAMPLDGLIGLQIHGGCKAEISFRNLTIEEVSDGAAKL
jgi:HEAT repeat protein